MMLHIGLDDTDSPNGGCTTYVAAVLVEHLISLGADFKGYPTLLRLNPNTPWKTRGNASMCLRFNIEESKYLVIKEYIKGLVDQYCELDCDNTNPGVAFLKGDVPEDIKEFSNIVVKSIVEKKTVMKLIEKYRLDHFEYKNSPVQFFRC